MLVYIIVSSVINGELGYAMSSYCRKHNFFLHSDDYKNDVASLELAKPVC